MERPQGLRSNIAMSIIVLFHVVGLVGLVLPVSRALFLQLVPWHILLMFIVLVFTHNLFNLKWMLFIAIITLTGFFGEWVGVHQHWLFGNYHYGKTLGTKLDGIPLIISLNWFLLIYAAGITMEKARVRSKPLRIVLGAILLVLLDLLIEPIAIRLDYWHWANNVIPIRNYFGWFLMSALLLFVFGKFRFKKQGSIAPVFLSVQFIFFALLNLLS